jgi:uncharacterized membrane protein
MGVLLIIFGIILLFFFIIALFSCLKMAKIADENDEKMYEQMKAKEKKDITEE